MNPLQFIELHFADELFIHAIHEKYVVPHNHSVFSRVDPREGPEIPILSPSQEDIPHQLQLHTFLRYNRLYDVYRGTITSNDLGVPAGIKCPDGNVMVKIMASDTFDDAGWNTETGFDTALEAVYDEAELIEDHLSTIESKPSPGFYGLFVLKIDGRWGLTRQVIVMILEDVTEPIHRHPVSTFAYLKDDLRNEIIKLVEDLHAAGIILEVLDFAQIRRRSDGKRDLAVVDFEFAMYIDPSGVEAILLDQQMWRLMSYLSVGREEANRPGGIEANNPKLWKVLNKSSVGPRA